MGAAATGKIYVKFGIGTSMKIYQGIPNFVKIGHKYPII
jgi:hypothetical protein